MEIWKIYRKEKWPENVKYEISSAGRVRNLKTGNFKKMIKTNRYGQLGFTAYLGKNDCIKGKTTTVILHRALAICFIPNPENKPFVIHKDHNISNNNLNNIAWASQMEWVKHVAKSPAILKEKYLRKTNQKRSYQKLTDAEAFVLKKKLLDPNRKTRIRILAKQFGVSEMQLYRIKSGENWGHIKV